MNTNMDKMIAVASSKLGVSPEKLRESLEKGNISEMLNDMRKEDAEKLSRLMSNDVLKEKLMKSPEAAEIIKKMQK